MTIQMNIQDRAVQAALIGAAGSIFTGLIAALCAGLIGQQLSGRRHLIERLHTAQRDIEFLLKVEVEHCEMHLATAGKSNKHTVRKRVHDGGHPWSGRFTPGRVRHMEAR
jgi:hypothetical protein